MTSEEFHDLVEENTEVSGEGANDSPLTLTLAQLAQLERQKRIKFPSAYKEFLSIYGAGDFGSVTCQPADRQLRSNDSGGVNPHNVAPPVIARHTQLSGDQSFFLIRPIALTFISAA